MIVDLTSYLDILMKAKTEAELRVFVEILLDAGRSFAVSGNENVIYTTVRGIQALRDAGAIR